MKSKPSAVAHSLRLVRLGALLRGCSTRDWRQVGTGCPLPEAQVLFLKSKLGGLTRIFGSDANFASVVADNLQEGGLDDLTVPSSLPPHMTRKTSQKILITGLSRAGTFIAYYGNGSADKMR